VTGPEGPAARVLALVPDLMDRSRITAAAGPDVEFVSSVAALGTRLERPGAGPAIVILDLARSAALDAVPAVRARAGGARILAFGAHVDGDRLARARAAGCDRVLARSAFFARLAELVGPGA
jgi:hypothetical protein